MVVDLKFIHMADMHFDIPFTVLSNRNDIGIKRRLEQRRAFEKVIEIAREKKISHLFIAGDLYEQEYVRKSTIEYINSLFQTIPNTKIWITPGNHDPYIKNSYYQEYQWNSNVHIFKKELEVIEEDEAAIYGLGFTDFYRKDSGISDIQIKDKDKINILIIHGSLDGSLEDNRPYNPMKLTELKKLGFDYIALGHIHKPYYQEEAQRITYPGSTISLGFDELGEHGILMGEIQKDSLSLEFKKIDQKEFIERRVDVSNIQTQEELIEYLNKLEIQDQAYCKLILEGKRNIEIDPYKIIKLIENEMIIKIKDDTTIQYKIEELANEINLKGLFANEILEQINQEKITKKRADKILEIGMQILNE